MERKGCGLGYWYLVLVLAVVDLKLLRPYLENLLHHIIFCRSYNSFENMLLETQSLEINFLEISYHDYEKFHIGCFLVSTILFMTPAHVHGMAL